MAKNSELAVVYREVDELRPYERNARTHSEAQVAEIAASIEEFGWTNQVLVDSQLEVIAGHGRLLAAKKLGLKRVPTIEIAGLSDVQRRALIIADNKLALNAGWDETLLALELGDLGSLDFDLGLTGFDADELDALLSKPTAGRGDPDEVPDPPRQAVSVHGDLWRLGEHRLYCWDCTNYQSGARLEAKRCGMIMTDPPYGIGYEYAEHDDRDNDANAKIVAEAFALGPPTIVWTPGANNLQRDLGRFGKTRVLIWYKRFAAAGNGLGGASTWEPILVVGKPSAAKLKNDVIEVMTDRETLGGQSLRKLHSCPKPVALYQHLLEALSKPNELIYEPFSGSGTTMIACERSGRRCRAVEISPIYVDVAILRWQQFTGQDAVHEATGRTFDETREDRAKEPSHGEAAETEAAS